MFCITPAAV
jgi:hypothetical protein